MKLTVVLAVLIGILTLACSAAAPAPAEPTPNIDATVEARAKQLVAAQATPTPYPTYIQAPKPTNTQPPRPINTAVPQPTNTPTLVPTPTSVPTPTPRPMLTPTPVPTRTPIPTIPTPPTKFEGGFVMLLGGSFQIEGKIAFKIGQYVAEQTVTVVGIGQLRLADLYATSTNSEVPYTAQTGSGSNLSPPSVIAGRAYIDGNYAPDGTVVTAWIGGEEIVEARTTVVNNPTPLAEPKLLSILQTEIPPPFPLPTPCPTYRNNCDDPYYGGRLADEIKAIWHYARYGQQKWWFYSPDPAWELAHNLPPDMCDYVETNPNYMPFGGKQIGGMQSEGTAVWEFVDTCSFGTTVIWNSNFSLHDASARAIGLSEGWSGRNLAFPSSFFTLAWPVSR